MAKTGAQLVLKSATQLGKHCVAAFRVERSLETLRARKENKEVVVNHRAVVVGELTDKSKLANWDSPTLLLCIV